MTLATPAYCTREQVKRALDFKTTARDDARVDRAIDSGSRNVESLCHRVFYPQVVSRNFDWPDRNSSASYRLWLGKHDLIQPEFITVNNVTLVEYFLYPQSGPPYTYIEVDRNLAGSFSGAGQRAINVEGLWGYTDATVDVGEVGTMDADDTTLTVSTGVPSFGVGSLLKIETEWLLVTEVLDVDTTIDLTGALTANNADTEVDVTDGSSFSVGEEILVGSERMLIVAVTDDTLAVKRAWDGSVLAAHGVSDGVSSRRSATVVRGAVGSSAAAHSQGATVGLWTAPSLVRDLGIAESINQLLQENSGYARVVGSGDNAIEAAGKGLESLRKDVKRAYGRHVRKGAV